MRPLWIRGAPIWLVDMGASFLEGDKLPRNRIGFVIPNDKGSHFDRLVNEAVHDEGLEDLAFGVGLAVEGKALAGGQLVDLGLFRLHNSYPKRKAGEVPALVVSRYSICRCKFSSYLFIIFTVLPLVLITMSRPALAATGP